MQTATSAVPVSACSEHRVDGGVLTQGEERSKILRRAPRRSSSPFRVLLSVLSVFLLSPLTSYSQTKYPFDLPAQPLAESLRAIGHQTSTNVMFEPRLVKGLDAPALRKETTPTEAIRMLLSGTKLTALQTAADTILIQRLSISEKSAPTSQALAPGGTNGYARFAQADGAASQAPSPVGSPANSASSEDASRQRSELEEIIVTAQKREQRLQDVPIPVTAVVTETLVNSNQNRIQEFYTRIPGLNVTPSVQGQQNLSIRGITTGFSNPTVGITIDDVPFGSSGGLPSGLMAPDLDPGDLARVEVLRGPQGALYGASSMGGLFKLVTVDPSIDEFGGRIQVGMSSIENGNGTGYNVRGSLNVPLSESVAIRASAFTRHDSGFIDDVATGQDGINEADIKGGRVSALFKASENWSVKLSAIHQEYEGDGPSEIDHLAGLGDLEQRRLLDSGKFNRELQAYSAVVNGEIGRVALTAVTGYNISDVHETFDFTGPFAPSFIPIYGPAIGLPVFTDALVKRFTQELRLTLPLGEKADWMLGGFYSTETNDFDQHTTIVNDSSGKLLGYRNILDNGVLNVRERAAFTNFTYHFTDRFDVQLGGRYSKLNQSKDAGTAQRFPPTGTGLVTIQAPISAEPDDVFTFLVTPSLRVSPDLMVYARVASGYRIGGGGITSPNDNCVRFSFPCQYGPDKTLNYEIGAKGDLFDRLLSFDTSVYYIDWKDIQIQGYNSPAGTTYNTNGSRAKSQGVELWLQSRPTDNLTLTAWGVYNNAELTEDLPVGPGLPVAVSGDRLPLGSEWSGGLSLEQSFPLPGDFSGTVGASATYIGPREGLFPANGAARVTYPSYAKIDLLGSIFYDDWTLNAFVNNLTDRHTSLSGGPGFFPPESAAIVQPRTVGMSLTKTF